MAILINEITSRASGLGLVKKLQRTEAFVDRYAAFAAFFVVLLFAEWFRLASAGIRFQFDELLELSAATAPSNGQVVSFLASGVDFNPPLSHFLVRASVFRFGNVEWAARLPAFAGMTVLLIFLYLFVAHQLSRIYGLVAMLLILCLPVRGYAVQARPYGLLLGLTGLALFLYRDVTWGHGGKALRHRGLALAAFAGCTAALVATHYYAVLVVVILLAASLIRVWELRRPDWPLLASCAGPPLLVLYLLRNVIGRQRVQLTHYFARGNLLSFDHGYDDLQLDPLIVCLSLLLIIAVLIVCLQTGNTGRPSPLLKHLPADTIALSVGLLSLPLLGALVTQFVTHAYVARYFVAASVGFVVCVCYGLRTLAGHVPGIVFLIIISLGLGFGKALLQETHHTSSTIPFADVLATETSPVLFDNPEAYLQVNHYVPAMRATLWVIADPSAALRYRHYDTDDRIMLALAGNRRAQTTTLRAAVKRWPSFRLVPRTGDYLWALKCLIDSGAGISVKRTFDSANLIYSVDTSSIHESLLDACAQ